MFILSEYTCSVCSQHLHTKHRGKQGENRTCSMQYNAVINVSKISLVLLGSREINFIRNNSTPSESLIQSAKTGFSPQQPLV